MITLYISFYSVTIAAISIASATIRENKLYVLYEYGLDFTYELAEYGLKNGTIKEICKSKKSAIMSINGSRLRLKFSDAPDILQAGYNKLWLKSDQASYDSKISSSNSYFMGYIDINNMTFIEDTTSVRFPATDKFPEFGYTTNEITNGYGSTLYAIGGVIRSKDLNAYVSSNSFFNYNHATKDWVDMTSEYDAKLDPIYGHRLVVMNNRYIILFGGKVAKDPTKNSILDIKENQLFKVNSIYNLMKFDTVTNTWESITLNTSMFDNSVASLQLTEFSANFHNNRVYLLGGHVKTNEKQTPEYNTKLGVLDYKAALWSWFPIFDEDGNIYKLPVEAEYSLIYIGQIILISGKLIEKDRDEIKVFDLNSQRMESILKASHLELDTESNSGTQSHSSILPSYAITLIAISCTVLMMLIIFNIYNKYNRNKKTHQNRNTEPKKPMEAIWSNPEEPNMGCILYGTKENCIYFDLGFMYPEVKLANLLYQKQNNTQEYFEISLGTANTSTTLQSNSSNY